MGRVFEHLTQGRPSRYLTDEDELIYPSDEALDEYAYSYEEEEKKNHNLNRKGV